MTLMAFAHCREYAGTEYYSNLYWHLSPAWLDSSPINFIQQMLVSTVASGGFFMMMGIGMVFLSQSRLKSGWSVTRLCRYLLLRGSLLILLQMTLLQLFEFISERKIYLYVGVLFSLGISMMFAAFCIYVIHKLKSFKSCSLEYIIPAVLMIGISLTVQAVIHHLHDRFHAPSLWKTLFILGGQNQYVDINFTPLPWFTAVAFGLIIGQILYQYRDKGFNFIGKLSLLLLVAWFIVRTGNLYGWFTFGSYTFLLPNETVTFASYFTLSKYPPSITYFLWSFGINLASLFILYKITLHLPRLMRVIKPVSIFGQCALFFFITHWFLYYGYSLLLNEKIISPLDMAAFWLLGLITLYPLCKAYHAFKSRQSKESIWRMF